MRRAVRAERGRASTGGALELPAFAALNNCLASLPSQCVPPGGTSERRNSLPKDAALEKKSRYSDSSTVLSEAMLAKVKLLFDNAGRLRRTSFLTTILPNPHRSGGLLQGSSTIVPRLVVADDELEVVD